MAAGDGDVEAAPSELDKMCTAAAKEAEHHVLQLSVELSHLASSVFVNPMGTLVTQNDLDPAALVPSIVLYLNDEGDASAIRAALLGKLSGATDQLETLELIISDYREVSDQNPYRYLIKTY